MENEDQQQAVQTETPEVVETPSVESTRPESTDAPSVADSLRQAIGETDGADVSATSTPETEKGGEDTERKQSRAERRVESLVDKLKQSGQQIAPNLLYGDQPIFTKEEIESGTFDPTALQQRLIQREERNRQITEQQVMQRLEYNNSINEHLSDSEVVQKELGNDPDLEKLVVTQYNALNTVVDPRTGQEIFVPKVKMSEILKQVKSIVDKKTANATASVSATLTEQANDQAVPVTVSSASNTDLEGQAAFEKAAHTGSTEDWAAVLKKRLKK